MESPESVGIALKQWNAPVSYRPQGTGRSIHAAVEFARRSPPRATPATWTCQTDSDAVLGINVIPKNKTEYRAYFGLTTRLSAALLSSSKESSEPRLPGQRDERRLSRPVTLSVFFENEGTPENNADQLTARCGRSTGTVVAIVGTLKRPPPPDRGVSGIMMHSATLQYAT